MSQKNHIVIDAFKEGWITELPTDKLPPGATPEAINDYLVKDSVVAKAPGYYELGSDTETSLECYDVMSVPSRTGDNWVFKSCGTKLKIFDTVNERFDTVVTGLTSGSRFGRAVFSTTFYLGNKDDTAMSFDLDHITRLDGALSGGEAVINVDDASLFPVTGTIYIKGTPVTYTGTTSTSFTGCSGTPVAEDDSLAVGSFSTHAGTPKGNHYEIFGGRLVVSGVEGYESTLYGSKATDRTNFTIAGGGASNDAFAEAMPSVITSHKTFLDDNNNERIIVSCKDENIYAVDVQDDAALGTIVSREPFKQGAAPLNYFGVKADGSDLIYIDQQHQLRSLASISLASGLRKSTNDVISYSHEQQFRDNYNFDLQRSVVNGNEYWVACRYSPTGDFDNIADNNKVLIYNLAKKSWRTRDLPIRSLDVYNRKIIFTTPNDNKVYQISSDQRSYDGSKIYFKRSTPDLRLVPLGFQKFRRLRVAGVMSTNGVMTVEIWRDFGSQKIEEFTIAGSNTDITQLTGKNGGSFGTVLWGGEVGGGESDGNEKFYLAQLDLTKLPYCYNTRIVFINNQSGVYLDIREILVELNPMDIKFMPDKYILSPN